MGPGEKFVSEDLIRVRSESMVIDFSSLKIYVKSYEVILFTPESVYLTPHINID